MNLNSVLEINLDIIKYNYSMLKQLSTSEVSAAVKANAYGLGATEIVKTLISSGCNKFFVASLGEAIELRNSFKEITIFVLSGIVAGEEEYFFEHKLIPVLNNLKQIEIFNKFCSLKNLKLPSVFHVDTGMNRLGITRKEFANLCENFEIMSHIEINYLMSHLASAEEENNEFNKLQLSQLHSFRQNLQNSLKNRFINSDFKASIANSAGILLGADYHLDLVRPGAAIYGLNSNNKMSVFRNPIRLFSRLIQVKDLAAGESLGYNLTHKLKKDSIIGTIGVGYADGIFRNLSNRGSCYINGYKTEIVGRISMDLINIDLSNIPENLRAEGQEVDIICDEQTPDMLAKDAGTIGYEIITSLGSRYKRKYIK